MPRRDVASQASAGLACSSWASEHLATPAGAAVAIRGALQAIPNTHSVARSRFVRRRINDPQQAADGVALGPCGGPASS